MTYEERLRFQEQQETIRGLRARLEAGDSEAPLTRAEGLELLGLLESLLLRVSPERWDRALEAVAHEAARRADAISARRG